VKERVFFVRVASVLGGLSVVLGAFGAHALRGAGTPDTLNAFETGVRYQFYHVIALLVVALVGGSIWESKWCARAAYAWCAGIVLFSGSLYALTLTGITALGAITPLGGVSFVIGWALLFVASSQLRGAASTPLGGGDAEEP
jgi:uncharacterized membrane protein YgdD (TMEM256/DUF423 family)